MRSNIIKIGNSNGVIIPMGVLKALNLSEKSPVTIQVKTDEIIIKKMSVRKGWAEAAKEMVDSGDGQLLIPDVFENEVFEEW